MHHSRRTCDAALADAAFAAAYDDDFLDTGQFSFLRQSSLHSRHRRGCIVSWQTLRDPNHQPENLFQVTARSSELTSGLSWLSCRDDVAKRRAEAETALRATRGRADEQVQPKACRADLTARAADFRAVIAMLWSVHEREKSFLRWRCEEKARRDDAQRDRSTLIGSTFRSKLRGKES